jgi:tRNA(Ile)-lysidine synthase
VAVDRFGAVHIARPAIRDASPDAARRILAIACVCAGGGERRPRAERVERLLQRIVQGEAFSAGLAGARVVCGDEVLILREAGEASRGGLATFVLEPDAAQVWDGRFELLAHKPGLKVGPLRGLMSRLGPAEGPALKAAPALARPALPAVTTDREGVTCPILAEGSQVSVRCLVGERFMAACGLIVDEDQALGRP